MYVPALAGLTASEIGLPNYQLPARTQQHFDRWLDRFSSWVIYTSLVALSIDPGLWTSIPKAGEERLLFGAEDYRDPMSSPAFGIMRQLGHVALEPLVRQLEAMTQLDAAEIPPLDIGVPTVIAPTMPSAFAAPTTGLPEWMRDQLGTKLSTPAQPLAADNSVDVRPTVIRARTGLLLWAVPTVLLLACWLTGLMVAVQFVAGAAIAAAAGAAAFAMAYRIHPWRRTRQAAQQRVRSAATALATVRREKNDLGMQRAALDRDEATEQERIVRTRTASDKQLERAREKAQRELVVALSDLDRRRAQQLTADQLAHGLLQSVQQSHIECSLANALISKAGLRQINAELVGNLARQGFHTAADFSHYDVRHSGRYPTAYLYGPKTGGRGRYVEQIGPKRAQILYEWRQRIGHEAMLSAPTQLSPAQLKGIRDHIGAQRRQHDDAVAAAKAAAKKIYDDATAQHKANLKELDRQEREARAKLVTQRANLDRKIRGLRRSESEAEDRLRQCQAELASVPTVSFGGVLRSAMRRV
jgi:hypothetical protein